MSLTCREWGSLTVGRDPADGKGLTENEARGFHALAERAGKRLKGRPTVLTWTFQSRKEQVLKAGQVVGILAIPRRTLEILPKIDGDDGDVRRALIHMLAVARGLRVADGELADLHTQRHDLLEILIGLFAGRLLAAVRRGLPRRYVEYEDDLRLLRGRLDVTRQVTHLAFRPDLLACRFDELSEDTPLNRVLKAAVTRLARIARSASNARRLADLAARFGSVGATAAPLREPVRLDRTNTAFHDLYRLARLFLEGDWQSTTGGGSAGFTLLFPMNDLFEEFIGQRLKNALSSEYEVRLQDSKHSALRDACGKPIFELKPDVVMERRIGGKPIVLDTKWKHLTPRAPRCERTWGVTPSDVYQMLAYAQAYDAERTVLLYPWHEKLRPEPPGINRAWTVPGTGRRLDVAAVDVRCRSRGVADALRAIVEGCGR